MHLDVWLGRAVLLLSRINKLTKLLRCHGLLLSIV